MITAHRHEFVLSALRSFVSQDYADRELVIYDNGDTPMSDYIRPHPLVRYFRKTRLAPERSVGELRNTAIDLAAGDLIATWDDDDWSCSTRLSEQAAALTAGVDLVGYHSMLFRDERRREIAYWRYSASDQDYAIGTSFLFRKSLWRDRPFPDLNVGEDNHWFEDELYPSRLKLKTFDAVEPDVKMISRVHHRCTSPKIFAGDAWSPIEDPDVIARCEALLL
jgi:glycosyltransferase involved in cell wall biosynthesis